LENRAFSTVFIIAAPRSGSNLLRDHIAQFEGVGTWPCDEINYIWRHGNHRHPTDEFPACFATPEFARYIQNCFSRLARERDLQVVLEKTCANSLRVEFLARIFPESRFIFLIRDGRDCTASAMERWQARVDFEYHFKKARFVPASDLAYYGFRFLRNRLRKTLSRQRVLATWGPRFEGMDEILRNQGLAVTCALQWKRCVELSNQALQRLLPSRLFRLRYEDLVSTPEKALTRVAEFLEIHTPPKSLEEASSKVTATSLGKWHSQLSAEERDIVQSLLSETLRTHGYS